MPSCRWLLETYISRPRILFASTFVWLTVIGGRFVAPFLEHEAHLTSSEIGIVLSCQQFVLCLASSWAGKRADMEEAKTPGRGRLKTIFIGSVIGTTAFLLHRLGRILSPSEHSEARVGAVFWHAMVQCIQGVGLSLVFPVLDGLTLDFLSSSTNDENRKDYGRERLHGPLWWAFSNLLLSSFLNLYGFSVCYPLSLFSVIFVGWSTMAFASFQPTELSYTTTTINLNSEHTESMTAAITVHGESTTLDGEDLIEEAQSDSLTDIPSNSPDIPLIRLLGLLTASSLGMAFLFCVFCISSGQAVVDNLIFLYFEALGSPWLVMGITVVIKIAAELIIFYIGPILLDRYGSATILLMGCICYLIRVVIYPFIPLGNIIYILLLEPLHGITYAASQISMVDFVASQMPIGYEASGQGIVYALKDGGSVMGLLLGSWADESVGPSLMFTICAGIVILGILTLSAALCDKFTCHPSQIVHEPLPTNNIESEDSEMNERLQTPLPLSDSKRS